MAEAVLFSLASNVLKGFASEIGKSAGSYASQIIQLSCCAKDELQNLEGTVEAIKAVLLDAEEKQQHNNEIALWLQRLKVVLYETDDLLDDVATEDLRRKVILGNKKSKAVRIFFFKLNMPAYRVRVAFKIRELRKRLDGFKKDRELSTFERREREETMAIRRRKENEILAPDEIIIGRGKDREQIKQLLFASSSSQSVSYVAIVGKGGLGKTALARRVYNDGDVKQHFEVTMWGCVSDDFQVNSIIKEILKSAKGNCQRCDDEIREKLQDLEKRPKHELPSILREVLSKYKYLLVLDDLWNDDRLKWRKLGDWLKHGLPGSKILITTRSHAVTQATSVESVYDLPGLSEGRSWDLFRKMAFGDEVESVDPDLENIGRDIVKKCGGVPLAIRHIGSLLSGEGGKDVWLHFQKHEIPEIPEIDENDEGIMQALRFSYYHLSSYLKHCFAYCSLFPKDYVYDKEEMIHHWVAQGFVESGKGDDKFEVANRYFSKLLHRSFFDVQKTRRDGEVVEFKMHDLMHDLAQIVAGGECKIIKFEQGHYDRRIRHASFIPKISSEEQMVSLPKNSKLRTFLYLKGEYAVLNGHEVFSGCRRCRVLGLDSVHITLPPSSFGKLKHLRFLSISGIESVRSLPDSITDLVNLQFLKINFCGELRTISGDFWKLVNLTYLSIDKCVLLSHLPPLSELPSLRTLILWDLLSLKFIQQTSDPEQSNTVRPFFPSLKRLIVYGCTRLVGWLNASQNHRSDNSQLSFPELRSVEIKRCYELKFVPSFPKVEYLEIDYTGFLEQQLMANPNCPSESIAESTSIPFSNLKRLHLEGSTDCPSEFPKVENLETSMVGALLRSATKLKSVSLTKCEHILSCTMRCCSSLEELNIEDFPGLEPTRETHWHRNGLMCHHKHQFPWRNLAELRVLRISGIWKLLTLPEEIVHVTTLKSLEISFCENLESLPEWIGKFSLLEKLVLSGCESLECMAFKMHKLKRFKELRIRDCPALNKECLPDGHESIPLIVWDD